MLGLSYTQLIFLLFAMSSSFVCAFNIVKNLGRYASLINIKKSLCVESATQDGNSSKRLELRALEVIKKSSYVANKSGKFFKVLSIIEKLIPKTREIELAGFKNSMNSSGLALARFKFAIFGAIFFSLIGFIFSLEMMAIGFFAGLIFGFLYLDLVLKRRIEARTEELERHLPEMLEIISIGMRSGLSFDRAIEIYSANFKTALSHEFASAQKLWMSGIKSRDCALRDIARGYDSMVFSRIIESIIRNLRLGTSVAKSLLSASKEARASYKSKREEEVRKAPIKMMIPTGTLILPAMLILIMGPVMLELIGGA